MAIESASGIPGVGAGLLHYSTRVSMTGRRAEDERELGLFQTLHERLEPIGESVMAAPVGSDTSATNRSSADHGARLWSEQ